MKFWVTRYALTTGIEVVEAEQVTKTMIKIKTNRSHYYHGRDWYTTEEAAKEHAEVMRVAKIESLKRSIEKLKKLKF